MTDPELTGIRFMPIEKYDVDSPECQRIINEAVARKLGPNRKKYYEHGVDDCHQLHPSIITYEVPGDYCHSIEAAWEIVEYMKTRHNDFHLEWGVRPEWSVSFCYVGNGFKDWSRADTAPMAICLAFLKLP